MSEVTFNIVVVLILIFLNALFAMAELAVVSARRVRLQQMVNEGRRGAQAALDLASAPNHFLSTVQVGITLIGIFAGAFGGATIAEPIAESLVDVPLIGAYSDGVSLVFVVSIITLLSVVLGELVPKRIALQNAERISALVARPMQALSVLATPVVRVLSLSTDAVLSVLGIQASPEAEFTEEEIRVLVRQGALAGVIEEAERDMVEQVFLLGDRPLETLMTPRPAIVWLDINAPLGRIRRTMEEASHARFPVCDGNLDHVLGIVRAKDLLSACLGGRPLQLQESVQQPVYLPGGMGAMRALEQFRKTGIHMGLVIDEYGGVDGLVTLIDILEAIVGEMPGVDELAEPAIAEREGGSWFVDGLLSVEEFKAAFEWKALPGEEKFQTVGGFIVYMIGETPTTGDKFEWDEFRFEVVDMDGYRVDKVLVERLREDENNAA